MERGYSALDTVQLLDLARGGDETALNALVQRCLPKLHRWASGRLPGYLRGVLDTDDLVQETVIRVLNKVDGFKPRREGSLHAYLRQSVKYRVQDEIRRAQRRRQLQRKVVDDPVDRKSPLEQAIGAENLERYEAALGQLKEEERELILMRLELVHSYKEIAEATGKPSPDAARMAVGRAIVRLGKELRRGGG